MPRNVAIVGCGQTKHGRLRDVNLAEMVEEAAWNALGDAQVAPEELDAIVVGNMQGFGGVAQSEQWFGDWIGAPGKPVLRVSTGGTTGGSVGQAAYYWVASGVHDTVLALAWERHSDSKEPGALTGLAHTGLADVFHALKYGISLKYRLATTGARVGAGALAVWQARSYIHRSGCRIEHFDEVAAKNRRDAAKNPYAHLRWPGCTAEDIAKTGMMVYPFRFGHICPASDGASAIVLTEEELARKKESRAWITGVAAYTDEENTGVSESYGGLGVVDSSQQISCKVSAMKAYEMAGIKDPKGEIDVAEVYQPFPSQELIYAECHGLFDEGTAWRALEEGELEIEGRMPVCPSGGVGATNAIGSSGLQRILECALQIMGKAGQHQVPKGVRNAVAHAWGAGVNLHTVTVLSDSPRK